jgi:hypothetical protein
MLGAAHRRQPKDGNLLFDQPSLVQNRGSWFATTTMLPSDMQFVYFPQDDESHWE